MNLIIDGYVRKFEGRKAGHHTLADTLMSSGEYRYYYGHAYDGDRKVVSSVQVIGENDGWRNVLDQALLNLPTVQVQP